MAQPCSGGLWGHQWFLLSTSRGAQTARGHEAVQQLCQKGQLAKTVLTITLKSHLIGATAEPSIRRLHSIMCIIITGISPYRGNPILYSCRINWQTEVNDVSAKCIISWPTELTLKADRQKCYCLMWSRNIIGEQTCETVMPHLRASSSFASSLGYGLLRWE